MFLSDIHLDVNEKIKKKKLKDILLDYIKEKNPDYLIIAGDLTGGYEYTIELLEEIEEETGVKVKFVPGNHDIWTNKVSSFENYEALKNHKSSLIDNPLELDSYVVIGDMGWYDYTFKPEFMNEEEVRLHKPNLWSDAYYAKWGMSDKELYEKMHEKIAKQLEENKDKKVIFVNHFLPYDDFLVFKNDIKWNTCNAFMGSSKLGELLDSYGNVEYVVFGHTHKRFGLMEFGNKKVICNPVGYTGEWDTTDFKKELETCGVIIEI